MKPIRLYIMDMNINDSTSGVDRYIDTLLRGLKDSPSFSVCRISLQYNPHLFFHTREQKDGYCQVVIPLPQHPNEMITELFWTRKYINHVWHIIRDLFDGQSNGILHLHTLNLIDLALLIRSHVPGCKIITHLHCIPWKGLYDGDARRFNNLYARVYQSQEDIGKALTTHHGELRSYTEADHIICVTDCAHRFLHNVSEDLTRKTTVICNGLNDTAGTESPIRSFEKTIRLLYVGVVSKSKGLLFILEALRKLCKKGYPVSLAVAGKADSAWAVRLKTSYRDLPVDYLGRLSFDELQDHYRRSDVGVIASLQEQCSYVAIEMAMYGLPIVTTAVDGLDEMFVDKVDALKVPIRFSKVFGLSVDVDTLSEKIEELIVNPELRNTLGANARKLYEHKFQLSHMMEQTASVYKKMTGEE